MNAVELLEGPVFSNEVANIPDESANTLNITGICLQVVASKAQLNLIPTERKRPVASIASSTKLLAERASTASQARQMLHGQGCDGYFHGGLNE
jgi:hypothetical protein